MSKKLLIESNSTVQKGDVIWAPYRRDPLWPALVQNVYPNKKVTFLFFPMVMRENAKKLTSFSCNPKLVFALADEDLLPGDASKPLLEAYLAAVKYLKDGNKNIGSRIGRRPEEDGLIKMDSKSVEEELAKRASNELADLLMNGVQEGAKKKSRKRPHPERNISETADTNSSLEEGVDTHLSRDDLSDTQDETIDDTAEGTSSTVQDPLIKTVLDQGIHILDHIWNSDKLAGYDLPHRHEMVLPLKVMRFFSDEDADHVFDMTMDFLKTKQPEFTYLPALHMATTVLIPELVAQGYQIISKVNYEEARKMIQKATDEEEDSKESPLDILMQAACDEQSRVMKD